MKIKYKSKIVNLDQYDKIEVIPKNRNYLIQSLCDDSTANVFCLVATRRRPSGGLFGGIYTDEEEIIGLKTREFAEELLMIVLKRWGNGVSIYDVQDYIDDVDDKEKPERRTRYRIKRK